jgi:iron complex outermembrane recepter protein
MALPRFAFGQCQHHLDSPMKVDSASLCIGRRRFAKESEESSPSEQAAPSGRTGLSVFFCPFSRLVAVTTVLVVLTVPPLAGEMPATGTVTGRVLNTATAQYLRNAVVSVKSSTLSTLSESGGVYTLAGVPAGPVELVVSYLGLDPQTVPVVIAPGRTVVCDVNLTSSDYDPEVVKLGRFVVSSEREGNAKAIMEQRHAENMKKVVASDAFGKVPENNVGEFLKLMPGVTTDYVEADVRAIRIRGYNPKYTSVMIDGARVAMAGSSTIGTGRTFEFEQLSISSVETVELSKTPTPDQPSTAAGTVNLRSRSAFDRKGRRLDYVLSLTGNSRDLTLRKSYGWDDQTHYKIRPNYAFEYSEVFFGERFGVLLGASRSDSYSMQQHLWVGGGGTAYNVDSELGNNSTEIPRANNIQFQHGLRSTVRTNQNVRFDAKLTPALSAWVKLDYNTFYNESLNRNFQMNVPANTPNTGVVNSPGGPVVPGVEYSLRSQTIYGGTWQMTNNGTARAKFGDTMILNGNVEFKRDPLLITAQAQFSRADNWYDSLGTGWFDNTTATSPVINWSWTRAAADSPKGITFTQLTGADARDPANYTFNNNGLTAVKRRSKDQIWSGRLDLRYKLDSGDVRTTLKAGVTSTLNTRDVERQEGMQHMLVGADGIANSGDNDRPADWVEARFESDWGWGGNANGLPVLDRFALARQYAANPSYFTVNRPQHLQTRLQNSWDFKERIDAAYIQTILHFERFDLSPGLRVEHTDSWGKGVNDVGDAAARRAVNPADPASVSPTSEAYLYARYGSRLTSGSSYTTPLAYLHGTCRIRENLLFRASYHDAITRADIANLIPGVSNVNESTFTLTTTNPALRPEKSKNVNLSLEYYFEPVGLMTVSWFGSRIKNLQRTRTGIQVTDTWLVSAYPGYTLSITENVANSEMRGFELDYVQQFSFLPGHLKGFGVFGNYTRLHFDTWDNYLNSPKHTWNAGLSYTKGDFYGQFRVNYTGRRQTSTAVNGWRNFDGERYMCDVSVNYQLNRYATLFVNGRNIFDEPIWGYQGREEAWARYARFGGFWELGVKGSF